MVGCWVTATVLIMQEKTLGAVGSMLHLSAAPLWMYLQGKAWMSRK